MEKWTEMSLMFVFLMLAMKDFSVGANDSTKVIRTTAGTFKGTVRQLNMFGETKTLEKFLGIRYAEPVQRFRKPILKEPLPPDSVYDATGYRASCAQLELPWGPGRKPGQTIEISEDCLFLNIYKPGNIPPGRGLATMVWFHGGGFVSASPQVFPGDMLSAYGDVIIVGVNYRLALWGFMSTGDETLPGNLGLWDQHTAIKWVHKYIKDFGGDPNNVTIFGVSAGASSVLYQSLFPQNRGYFQRVIGMSGSITCPWSFQPNPYEVTVRFAALLGCDTKLPKEEIVHCIESKSAQELKETLNKEENGFVKFPMEFVTVVDGDFVKSDPYEIIKEETSLDPGVVDFFASLDFMTGIVSGEGVMSVGPFVGVKDSEHFTVSKDEFEKKIVPEVANLMFGDGISNVVTDLVIHEYSIWSDPESAENSRTSFLEMTGDYVFNFHAKLVADMHANLSAKADKGGKTFAYLSEAIPSQHILWTPTWITTANHADDCTFLFGYDKEGYTGWTMPYSDDHEPAEWELRVSKLYMTLFTNFAKSG